MSLRKRLHHRKLADRRRRFAQRGGAGKIGLDRGLALAVEAGNVDGPLAEVDRANGEQRHAAAERGRHTQLLEHLAIGARTFLQQDAHRDDAIAGVELGERLRHIADGGDADGFRQALGGDPQRNRQIETGIDPQLRSLQPR